MCSVEVDALRIFARTQRVQLGLACKPEDTGWPGFLAVTQFACQSRRRLLWLACLKIELSLICFKNQWLRVVFKETAHCCPQKMCKSLLAKRIKSAMHILLTFKCTLSNKNLH